MRELKDEELEFVYGGSLDHNGVGVVTLPIASRPLPESVLDASPLSALDQLDISQQIDSELLNS